MSAALRLHADRALATRQGGTYWVWWWVIAGLSLFLRTGFPIRGIATSAFDDALFIRQARYLGAGMWLGNYDNVTLAKGMFYPLFIVISFISGIPLNVAEQAVYLAACAVMCRLLLRWTREPALALVTFGLLAFNPVVWNWEMDRVIREGLYIGLTMLTTSLALAIAFPVARHWANRLLLACALGASFAAFWLTREEGPWLFPALVTVAALSLLPVARVHRLSAVDSLRSWSRLVLLPASAAALVAVCLIGAVAAMNYVYYGVFMTNEFKSTPFLRAYGALSRIDHDRWQRYVVFPKDARQRAYSVSEAARELAPVLDGARGEAWRQIGCDQKETKDCPEILSGWFMWALREAAATAGHYRSAREAMAFYTRLADEIDQACDTKRIPCGPPRATLMPVFRWGYVWDALRDLPTIGRIMLTMGNQEIGSNPSTGPQSGLAVFSDMVGDLYPAHGAEQMLQGWAASPNGKPEVLLHDRATGQVDTTVSIYPGPDVASAYPGAIATRFDIRTSCPADECDLIVRVGNNQATSIPLSDAHVGLTVDTPEVRVFFDYAGLHDRAAAGSARRDLLLRLCRPIAWAYSRLIPPLSLLALAGVVIAAIKLRSAPVPLPVFATAIVSAVAIAARAALLAYLDVTSIPSHSILYTSPASPFVLLFTALGCWSLWRCLVPERPR